MGVGFATYPHWVLYLRSVKMKIDDKLQILENNLRDTLKVMHNEIKAMKRKNVEYEGRMKTIERQLIILREAGTF